MVEWRLVCRGIADNASNIAMMLEKDTGKAITQKDGLTVALNFNPVPVKHNMVRTFHYNDTEEKLFN